jgi:hypothetical protein
VVGEKLTNEACSVTGFIVVMENPVLLPSQIRSLLLNVLPHTPQNFAVRFCVDGLALGNEFAINNATDVENYDEHSFH